MYNKSKLGLFIILIPAIVILTSLLAVLPITAITQCKRLYKEGIHISMQQIKNMVAKTLYSKWCILIIAFCLYKCIIKYQLVFKYMYYDMKQSYISLDFSAKESIVINNKHQKSKYTKKSCRRNNFKQHTHEQQKSLSDHFTFVAEGNKKNKKTAASLHLATVPPTTTNKPNKSDKRPHSKPKQKRGNQQKATSKIKKPLQIKTSNIKPETATYCWTKTTEDSGSEEVPVVDDIPYLSDNESLADSVQSSPCLDSRALPSDNRLNYYSPFSTGFDLDVFSSPSPIYKAEHRPSMSTEAYSTLLSEKIISPYFAPSVDRIPSYTPKKQPSLLELLDPADHVETTITPASFSYFDEMMMSTSLYRFNHHPSDKDQQILYKSWDSISNLAC
ncbi:MAG: hypothetical protein EXX96DRAFT_64719 [Benjaminiella poitrasii]|nr:MAG: hypothetical protein EXX96DRAFT_64719 [Benjaminiella poitrasii]